MPEWELTKEEIQKWAERFVNPSNVPFCLNDGLKEMAQAQARKIVEWGDALCQHGDTRFYDGTLKRQCSQCWAELKREVGL